jgi:methylmalonyl-CoA mutase cobalamin-binding subunit
MGIADEIKLGVAVLADYDPIKPHVWTQLTPGQKAEALQGVEDRLAAVQGRPACRVVVELLPEATDGGYDQLGIAINAQYLDDVARMVEAVAHEGRHAYQEQVVAGGTAPSDEGQARAWGMNLYGQQPQPGPVTHYIDHTDVLRDVIDNSRTVIGPDGRALTPEEIAEWVYQAQPVEDDAWTYGKGILNGLYGAAAQSDTPDSV